MKEKNIDQLPPVHALTRDRTHSSMVRGLALRPPSHPARAFLVFRTQLCQDITHALHNSPVCGAQFTGSSRWGPCHHSQT